MGNTVSLSVSESVSASVSVRPSLGVASTNSMSIFVVGRSHIVSEVSVMVTNTESLSEGMSVVTERSTDVLVTVSSAESASVTSA